MIKKNKNLIRAFHQIDHMHMIKKLIFQGYKATHAHS